jgi:potassium/chloride transporter 4/5/6
LVFKGGQSFPGNLERVGKHEQNATIDIWWLCHDGGLLLLLPFLLSRNAIWRGAKLRLFAGITSPIVNNLDRFKEAIEQHLRKARIQAEVQVVDLSHLQNITTSVIESPPIHPDADSDSVEGTLLYQLLSPEKTHLSSAKSSTPRISDCKVLEDSLDRSSDETRSTATDPPETPRQRLTFVGDDACSSDQSAAVILNEAIRSHSTDKARLVVTNLPLLRPDTRPMAFVNFVDTMTRDIDNVLLVRGAGNEVITHVA